MQADKNAVNSVFGEYITTSELEITLEPSHNGGTVICEASHHGYLDKVSGQTTLRVSSSLNEG